MRVLPTKVHGAIDYLWGLLLIASPGVLGFSTDRAAFWVALIFGGGAIAYSLVTDYELGLVRLVPVPAHLLLDAVAGVALALTPLAVRLAAPAGTVFVAFGLFAVAASLVTRTRPGPQPT